MNRKQFFTLTEKIISDYHKLNIIDSRIHHAIDYKNRKAEIHIRLYLSNFIVILKIITKDSVIDEVEYYRYWIYQHEIKFDESVRSVCALSKQLSVLIGEKLDCEIYKEGCES